tara:strand:+ start:8026 stop:9240 length:1215 start_codon:yes stop_codon:yes gene_type:complete
MTRKGRAVGWRGKYFFLKNKKNNSYFPSKLIALFITLLFLPLLAYEKVNSEENSKLVTIPKQELTSEYIDFNQYILGSGDIIDISVSYIPELSGKFQIGPEGLIYLPEVGPIIAEGVTLDQLRTKLIKKYSKVAINPNIYVRIFSYKPVRVFVRGEVSRPGFYSLTSGTQFDSNNSFRLSKQPMQGQTSTNNSIELAKTNPVQNQFPTLFDALRSSQGVTAYSDLSNIQIIRKLPGNQNSHIETNVNLLSLFMDGDQSQNIRIFDKDIITVSRNNTIVSEQLEISRKSNLNPDNIQVYISGEVKQPGKLLISKGSTLNHAIAMAGGKELLSGNIVFMRFYPDGEIDKRTFRSAENSKENSYKNPVLWEGDIIQVKDSLFVVTSEVLSTVSRPFIGLYSIINLFD